MIYTLAALFVAMLFEVTRTSQDGLYDHKIPPCGDVVWHSNRWVVHIDTLEDLLAFVEKYGGRVVIRQLERVRWMDNIR